MKKNNNSSSSGLGIPGVLTIIFVVLKLVGVINWSWWWVFSPILIEIGLAILILVGWAIWFASREEKFGGSRRYKNNKK